MSGVEAKNEQLFKKQKVIAEKCDIVVIDEEGEFNSPDKGIIIEEENSTKKSQLPPTNLAESHNLEVLA